MLVLLGALVIVGLALGLVNPAIWLWVAAGLALPFLLDAVRGVGRALGISRDELVRALLALVGIGAFVFVAAFLAFSATDPLRLRGDRPEVAVEALYEGEGRLVDDDPRLEVTDTLTVTPESIESAAKAAAAEPDVYKRTVPPPGGDFARALRGDIEAALTAQGWTAGPPSTAGREFRRVRRADVDYPDVWAQRTIALSIPRPRLETDPPSRYVIELRLADESELVVTAEKHAVGGSFPKGETEAHQRDDDLEQTAIPAPDEGEEVELRLRRPLFREEPFVRAADLTPYGLWGLVVTLILGALAAVVKDELKAIFKRWLDRILGRKPDPED